MTNGVIMSSTQDRKVTTYLSPEDFRLFEVATKRYAMKPAKLVRDVLHSWLFDNKLKLQE